MIIIIVLGSLVFDIRKKDPMPKFGGKEMFFFFSFFDTVSKFRSVVSQSQLLLQACIIHDLSGFLLGESLSMPHINDLGIQGKHLGEERQSLLFGKADKMRKQIQKLRENFKSLEETKQKNKKREHGIRKLKGNTSKLFQRCKEERNKSGGGRNETKYYLEDGTYKENENFEIWAEKLRKMWKKVNCLQ